MQADLLKSKLRWMTWSGVVLIIFALLLNGVSGGLFSPQPWLAGLGALLVVAGAAARRALAIAAKADLAEEAARYRRLYDTASDMILLHDCRTGKLVDANPGACRLLGRSRADLRGSPCVSLLASREDENALERLFRSARHHGRATRVTRLIGRDNRPIEVEIRATPMSSGPEEDIMLCIGRDLTAQHLLERRALAFYQAFQNSNDSMFYTNREGIIQEVNEAFLKRFGFRRDEIIGQTPRVVRSEYSTPDMYKRLWGDILDPAKGFWRGRVINRTKSGEEVPIILSITSVLDDRGRIVGFVSSAVDLSEHETLQRRLAKSESLAAVGSMAAVMAHEIRNPLGSIVTASRSLNRHDLSQEDHDTLTEVIGKESKRLSDTLSQFLQYARPRELHLAPTDVNELLSEIGKLASADESLAGAIVLREELNRSLPRVPADADQLRQVLWNVVINAIQAMDGRGALTLRTGAKEHNLVVDIDDDGPGIPEGHRESVFEPFHTTKERGTGLGLPVAERIVSAHGGRITIDSSPSGGARFTILIPLRNSEAA
jgi:PAS domain S-box-containing protein